MLLAIDLRLVQSLCRALRNVRDPVELGAEAAIPERMKRTFLAWGDFALEFLGDDRERATHPCEPAALGEAAKLNGTFARACDFIDRNVEFQVRRYRPRKPRRRE